MKAQRIHKTIMSHVRIRIRCVSALIAALTLMGCCINAAALPDVPDGSPTTSDVSAFMQPVGATRNWFGVASRKPAAARDLAIDPRPSVASSVGANSLSGRRSSVHAAPTRRGWLLPERSARSNNGVVMSADGQGPRIIIAGAPASGKGTQCSMIKERYGVVHLSTGEHTANVLYAI